MNYSFASNDITATFSNGNTFNKTVNLETVLEDGDTGLFKILRFKLSYSGKESYSDITLRSVATTGLLDRYGNELSITIDNVDIKKIYIDTNIASLSAVNFDIVSNEDVNLIDGNTYYVSSEILNTRNIQITFSYSSQNDIVSIIKTYYNL